MLSPELQHRGNNNKSLNDFACTLYVLEFIELISVQSFSDFVEVEVFGKNVKRKQRS